MPAMSRPIAVPGSRGQCSSGTAEECDALSGGLLGGGAVAPPSLQSAPTFSSERACQRGMGRSAAQLSGAGSRSAGMRASAFFARPRDGISRLLTGFGSTRTGLFQMHLPRAAAW